MFFLFDTPIAISFRLCYNTAHLLRQRRKRKDDENEKLTKLYSLKALAKKNIDSWVEAISKVAEMYSHVIGMKPTECPAEYEYELTSLADEEFLYFDEEGNMYQLNK